MLLALEKKATPNVSGVFDLFIVSVLDVNTLNIYLLIHTVLQVIKIMLHLLGYL